jgi:hypothetical protein
VCKSRQVCAIYIHDQIIVFCSERLRETPTAIRSSQAFLFPSPEQDVPKDSHDEEALSIITSPHPPPYQEILYSKATITNGIANIPPSSPVTVNLLRTKWLTIPPGRLLQNLHASRGKVRPHRRLRLPACLLWLDQVGNRGDQAGQTG